MSGKQMELIEQGRFLGEEFILWLWMRGLKDGGTSGIEGDQSACFLDDALALANERGDVKELTLRKGNPAESREAFEALGRGMRPVAAKVRALSGDMEWVFTLKAATLETSAMKLPPTSAKALHDRAADRLFLLEEGTAHLERRYQAFLERRSGDSDGLRDELLAWIRTGLSGEDPAEGEVPWEE